MDFRESETAKNLMRAFAGESQARNRYTMAASQAKANGLYVIETVFTFTADQEKEHAKLFYRHLKDMAGETIAIDGGYPVDIDPEITKLLRMAQHNEMEEYGDVYKHFGDTAKQEGFTVVGNLFHNIAEIEKTHGERFEHFAQLMENGQLFVSEQEIGWMCLNCGYIYTGKEAPKVCPVCQHPQGYFIRQVMAPFDFSQMRGCGC